MGWNIKKTTAGDLLFMVEGGVAKAEALRKEIRIKVQVATVTGKASTNRICIINGLNEIMTESGIVTEILKITRGKLEEIKVRYGNQKAIIELPTAQAAELRKRGKIEIW